MGDAWQLPPVAGRWVPVTRAGLYVPGGRVAYPSRVVMNVVPAQVAGVSSLAVASPPQADRGLPHPAVLAACALLGIDEVYAVGGAQALAMFAYGTECCARADVITGPGNVYVAAAKRLLRGIVGIDAETGPTEIAILADETADPGYVAADLIAQAEHDPLAACLLVTSDRDLLARTEAELTVQLPAAPEPGPHRVGPRRPVRVRARGRLDAGLAVVNVWAPEHLEIQTGTRAWSRRGSVTRGPSSSGRTRRFPSATTWPAPTTCCPPAGPPGTPRGCRCCPSFVSSTWSTLPRGLAEAAPYIDALGGAEDLPLTWTPSGPGCPVTGQLPPGVPPSCRSGTIWRGSSLRSAAA